MWLLVNGDVERIENGNEKVIKRNTAHAVVAIRAPCKHLALGQTAGLTGSIGMLFLKS